MSVALPRLLLALGLAGCAGLVAAGGKKSTPEGPGDRFKKAPPPPTPSPSPHGPPQNQVVTLPRDAEIYKTIIQGQDPASGVSYEVRFSAHRRYDETALVIETEPVPDLLYTGEESFDTGAAAVIRLAKNAEKGDAVAAGILRQIDPAWIGLTATRYDHGWEFPGIHGTTSKSLLELSRFHNGAAFELLRQGVAVNPWFLGALIHLCLERRVDACKIVKELDPKNYKGIPLTDKATADLVEGGLLARCAAEPNCQNPKLQPPWQDLFNPSGSVK